MNSVLISSGSIGEGRDGRPTRDWKTTNCFLLLAGKKKWSKGTRNVCTTFIRNGQDKESPYKVRK